MANSDQTSKINLRLSATFPNLQRPENISRNLRSLTNDFPGAFKWAGELNIIKHALVGNGFFKEDTSPRITKKFIEDGNLDAFFKEMESKGWPVNLHCDFGMLRFDLRTFELHYCKPFNQNSLFQGCDNYDAIPKGAFHWNPIKDCTVPESEMKIASQQYMFWKDLLGEFYPAFFNRDQPKKSAFKKIQHLQLMDTIMKRYPGLKVVWAHMGLSKELKDLHPRIHTHIMEHFFNKFPNLYVDLSWDVLPKRALLNFNPTTRAEDLSAQNHADIHAETSLWNKTHINEVSLNEDR